MKKLMLAVAGVVLTTALTGCGYKYQPHIYFHPDGWEVNKSTIVFPYGTDIDYGHAYDVTQTENGFDITIHFVAGSGDKE